MDEPEMGREYTNQKVSLDSSFINLWHQRFGDFPTSLEKRFGDFPTFLFHYRASSSLPSGVMLFNLYPFAPCDCNWIPYSLDNWIPYSLDNWILYSLDNWIPYSLDNWILCSLDNWMPYSLDNWMPCSYDLRIPCSYDIRIGILGHFLY